MTRRGWRMMVRAVSVAAAVWVISGCGAGSGSKAVGEAESSGTAETASDESRSEEADETESGGTAETASDESGPEEADGTGDGGVAEETVSDGSGLDESAESAENGTALEPIVNSADIRVMSFNVLVEGSGISLDGRDEKAAAAIMAYRPDVIGMQEVDQGWYDRLTPLIGDTYEFLYRDNTQGGINRTTVAYNTETLSLIDSGVDIYTEGATPNDRLMTWGVFETADGGKRFAVIDTHWDTNKHADYRFAQAEEMGRKVLALKEEYGCPVICTGDFNTNRLSGEFKNFLELSQTKDAQANVENAVNGEYRSQHTICGMPDQGKTSIDHITYTDDADARFFMVLMDQEVLDASDHCPLITDFMLGAGSAEITGETENIDEADKTGGLGLTDGADIRVMSFNILAERFGVSLDGRDEKAAAAILAYRPDVVGLQEVDQGWYDRLEPLIGDTYQFLYKDNMQGGISLTTVVYNTETLTLVDSGVDIYTKGDSPSYRLMTWGVFETADSGKRFAVIDTHWDTNKHADYRFTQAEEMGRKVLALAEEYGCPVICTGDFNTNRLSGEFKNFLELSQMKDAQANVENAVNGEYRSQHTICGMPDQGKTSIDHITYTDDADARFFMVLMDQEVLDVSDHCPLITDFMLKERE